MANYRVSTDTNNNNKTTEDKTNKQTKENIKKVIIIIIRQFNSFFICVLAQQPRGQLQKQHKDR
jgi:hypothetical protein